MRAAAAPTARSAVAPPPPPTDRALSPQRVRGVLAGGAAERGRGRRRHRRARRVAAAPRRPEAPPLDARELGARDSYAAAVRTPPDPDGTHPLSATHAREPRVTADRRRAAHTHVVRRRGRSAPSATSAASDPVGGGRETGTRAFIRRRNTGRDDDDDDTCATVVACLDDDVGAVRVLVDRRASTALR